MANKEEITGRFAPSPTGRMHLGNVLSALLSWLSVRSRGGRWILRIEDLDPQRSRREYALQIEDDLCWLGLDWDEGGYGYAKDGAGYRQSLRSALYQDALERLQAMGLTYPCRCTRAALHATQAPHAADGVPIYAGTCRPGLPPFGAADFSGAAVRLYVPEADMTFTDRVFGRQSVNLSRDCGDFVLRRADGAFAYQLAVTVDDALMGVTEVVRGCDLLLSTPRQLYLYKLMGWQAPEFAHVPLLCNSAGQRLSKRDASLSLEALRRTHSPEQVIGIVAHAAGLTPSAGPVAAAELARTFDWAKIQPRQKVILRGF